MDRIELLTRIAWLYYMEDLTQAEIGRHFHMSRVKVARLLKKARQEGLVQIHIANARTSQLALEKCLRTKFGLADALVVPTPVRPEELRPALGEAAAGYLSRIFQSGMSIALGMGRTLAEIPQYIDPPEHAICHFVEMVGGIGRGLSFDSYKVSTQLADRCGGEVEHVYTPVIVDSAATRQALLHDSQIKSVLERAAKCQLALVGVGTVDQDSFLYQAGYTDEAGIKKLQQQGAVGDILGRFFDLRGQPVSNPIDERLVGLSLANLKRIPQVLCVAGGPAKVSSILGALNGKYVNVLITDENTAQAVLAEKG